jgi:uncharacterized protein (DUF342 family)
MGLRKALIEPGEYAYLNEEDEAIYSEVAGYPKITRFPSRTSSEMVTMISIEPLFIISKDNMRLTVALHPPLPGGRSLRDLDLQALLREHNIVYGIDPEAYQEIVDLAQAGDMEFKKIVLAKGQPVGECSDAYLDFALEIGPIAGTVLANGSIDFRERRIMVGISAGQKIATKVEAVQGESGIDIYGQESPGKDGRDLDVKLLNDATFDHQSNEVRATKDGVLSIVNNNVIKVLSHTTISSDISYETGNVESMNAITVQGAVQPGFSVKAGGDVKILGGVMSGVVNCSGNLVIHGGITGKNSVIACDGDADINFIEQGQLRCGGICVLRKQSYYSEIIAGRDIRCDKLTKIMGGKIYAAGDITLWDVGGGDAKPTILAAGVLPDRLEKLNMLKSNVVEQQEAIITWLQHYPGSSNSKKIKNMEKELAETKLQLLRVNLIPGSGFYSRVAAPPEEELENPEEFSDDDAIEIENIKITVHGTVYAGTQIRIGNRTLKLEKTVSGRQFRLHANGKRIIAIPVRD